MFLLAPLLSVLIEWRKQSCFNVSGKIDVDAATKNVSDLCSKNLSVLLLAHHNNLRHTKEDLVFCLLCLGNVAATEKYFYINLILHDCKSSVVEIISIGSVFAYCLAPSTVHKYSKHKYYIIAGALPQLKYKEEKYENKMLL